MTLFKDPRRDEIVPVEDEGENEFSSYDEKSKTKTAAREDPTSQTYGDLEAAYDYFNLKHFDMLLPPVLVTLQRKSHALGYFCGSRFKNVRTNKPVDEIALNPDYMANRSIEESLSTLVHEQCHVWQYHFSAHEKRRKVNRAYHDREWAAKMEEIGLMPSDTAEPGGRKTGRRVSHYIVRGGRFQLACHELLASGYSFTWLQNDPPVSGAKGNIIRGRKKTDPSKVRFTCPACGQNAWAKQTVKLACLVPACNSAQMVETLPETGG